MLVEEVDPVTVDIACFWWLQIRDDDKDEALGDDEVAVVLVRPDVGETPRYSSDLHLLN